MKRQLSYTGMIAIVSILSALSMLAACSKKAPEPQPEAKPTEVAAEAPKAEEPAPEAKPAEAPANAVEQAPANEDKQAEAAPGPENPPKQDDNHTDLALYKDCVVTHCKNYKGPGHYWLDCDTEAIVEAGFAFGDNVSNINYKKGKPVYRTLTQGRGDNCGEQGRYDDKCFVNQNIYIKYIIENQLICNYEDNATTCIYDDDEHKKCRSKKLKFAFPNLKNTWGDKADADMTLDELEAKYISFWGKRLFCDLEGTYACSSLESVGCHCNRIGNKELDSAGECYCPDGDPVTAGEFPESSCRKNVCNPLNPKDCREVMTACPDNEANVDEDGDHDPTYEEEEQEEIESADMAMNPEDCTRHSKPGAKGCTCNGTPIDIKQYTCEPSKNGKLVQVCTAFESDCSCGDEKCPPLAVCDKGHCVDRATLKPLSEGYRFAHGLLRCNRPEGCACGKTQCEHNKYCMNGLCFRDPFTKKIDGKVYYYRFVRTFDSRDDAIAQSILYEDDNKKVRDFEKELKQFNLNIEFFEMNDKKRDMTIGEFLKTCGGNPIPKDVATKYCYIRLKQSEENGGSYFFSLSGWQDDDYWKKNYYRDFDWEPEAETP